MRFSMYIVAAGLALSSGAASAVTLSLELDGLAPGDKTLNAAFDLDDADNQAPGWTSAGYAALAPAGFGFKGDAVTELKGPEKTAVRGLSLTEAARVTFTYLGEEAFFSNTFELLAGGETLFTGNGVSRFGASVTRVFGPGMMDFGYVTQDGASIANNGGVSGRPSLNIAYSEIFNGGRSVITFFGDDTGDSDNDDLAVRIDVAPIPLPASAWLLLAGLGALAARGRR